MKALILSCVAFLIAGMAFAGPRSGPGAASLTTARDTTLFQSAEGSLADGDGPHIRAGRTNQSSQSIRRGLLEFDAAGQLPAGVTITRATLVLHLSQASGAPAEAGLYRVEESWGEGGSISQGGGGASAAPGDATWLHRFHDPAASADSTAWDNPGGSFAPALRAGTLISAPGYYSWSSRAMAHDVQRWVDEPDRDHGWILLGDENNGGTAKRFDSRENPDPAFHPLLIVEYRLSGAGQSSDDDSDSGSSSSD